MIRFGPVLLVLVLAMTGCGSAQTVTGSSSISSTPTRESTMPASRGSGASSSGAYGVAPSASPDGECLYTQAQISSALAGTWTITPGDDSCNYVSDQGSDIATVSFGPAIAASMAAARSSCVTGAKPVRAGHGFVCVELQGSSTYVEGNVLAGGKAWATVISVPDHATNRQVNAAIHAVAALLETLG